MRVKRTPLAYLSALLILLLFLAACGGEAEPTAEPESAEAPAAAAEDEEQADEAEIEQEEDKADLEEEGEEQDEGQEAEAGQEEEAAVTNAVTVADQAIAADGTVTIASVTSDTPGWLVVHAQADGRPGPVIGFAPVGPGQNNDLTVEIDQTAATDTLYAMLHVDAGAEGEYEFPGDDVPATDTGGNVVTPPFQVTLPQAANAVTVADQALGDGNTVTIGRVASGGPGWIVIHAQADGSPGPVIGYAPVDAGENRDVTVEVDPEAATGTLYAMLHVDAGAEGEYEFPGDDVPATNEAGNVVTPSFDLIPPTVQVGGNDELGEFLVASNQMTLYIFTEDDRNKSNCYDDCAVAWPPLIMYDGETPTAGPGVSGELDLTRRDDGTMQVTYKGQPLYYWISDQAPGDATGQGVGEVWFVVAP